MAGEGAVTTISPQLAARTQQAMVVRVFECQATPSVFPRQQAGRKVGDAVIRHSITTQLPLRSRRYMAPVESPIRVRDLALPPQLADDLDAGSRGRRDRLARRRVGHGQPSRGGVWLSTGAAVPGLCRARQPTRRRAALLPLRAPRPDARPSSWS